VIIDFKASAVKDQKEADKKTRHSLQMDLYAYSFLKTQEIPLLGTRLYFLESGLVGFAEKDEAQIRRAEEKILEVEKGIRSRNFPPAPGWHTCQHCEFRTICPHSYAY
ncbi:MAG: PD-(D/E)XK nuclease family protein, partial [Acidobacteriota bacterium]